MNYLACGVVLMICRSKHSINIITIQLTSRDFLELVLFFNNCGVGSFSSVQDQTSNTKTRLVQYCGVIVFVIIQLKTTMICTY